ncbi:MAG: SDR family NAD(P)-dependent oxidoreductase [Proteobacteria bacterium]|nr:MAG: SDR family NAD(P)-dependent oxidoreductase [Pseudomonadota bacterium]
MAQFSPKKLKDQVIVITGASSGIGLATAKMAAKKGAKVVLASRNIKDLRDIVRDIKDDGGEAYAVTTDVAKEQDMRRLAREAVAKYGRIDTWINNAGVGIFGETPIFLLGIETRDQRLQRRLADRSRKSWLPDSLLAGPSCRYRHSVR